MSTFARAFALSPGVIVHEDADLLVVAKPCGIASQAADPAYPDDLVTALEDMLESRDGTRPSLGVHQRLDRDTSGVMVFAKSARANRSLAKQLEGRTVEKSYVAAVIGGPKAARTLVHQLSSRTRGRVEVVTDGSGSKAVTRVVPLEQKGDSALLGLTIETGRTHQIRVQLAASGWAVAGDTEYGGARAPRLMLHAASLKLRHPADERELTFKAKVPRSFKRFLEGEDHFALDDPRSLEEALARACMLRRSLHAARGDDRATSVFRLLHGEGDGVPGLLVDVYEDYLVAQLASDEAFGAEDVVLDALFALAPRGIYLKRRPRKASDLVTTRDETVAPTAPVRGEAAPDPLVVREHAVPFSVQLGDGLGTGLYLDQRDNRWRVIDRAKDARVLNLFAYACAFSMAAARGGARAVTSVDASAPALALGEAQMTRVFPDVPHEVVHADVFVVLDAYAREGRVFDVVICDPPTYATTKTSRWASGEDWRALTTKLCAVLAPGGMLIACSNDQRMRMQTFKRHVAEGAAGVDVEKIRTFDPPRDFPANHAGEPHMKTVVVTRAG